MSVSSLIKLIKSKVMLGLSQDWVKNTLLTWESAWTYGLQLFFLLVISLSTTITQILAWGQGDKQHVMPVWCHKKTHWGNLSQTSNLIQKRKKNLMNLFHPLPHILKCMHMMGNCLLCPSIAKKYVQTAFLLITVLNTLYFFFDKYTAAKQKPVTITSSRIWISSAAELNC